MSARFLTRKQFAGASTYSLRSVDTFLKSGVIRGIRLPGSRRVLIPASELDRLEELAQSEAGDESARREKAEIEESVLA